MIPERRSSVQPAPGSPRPQRSQLTNEIDMAEAVLKNASQRSRKATLLAECTRNFCEIERPERADIEQFKELFYQLIGDCEKSERRLLAASLARHVFTPRQILMYLVMDSADIAAPILLFSPSINEFDIAMLAGKLPLDHLKILCRRHDLSEESAKILERTGGAECAELLSRNPALARRRREAGIEVAAKPQNGNSAASQSAIPDELAASRDRTAIEQELVDLAARGGRAGRKQAQNQQMFDFVSGQPLEAQLLRAARTGSKNDLAHLIESFCGARATIINRLLDDPDAQNLCVLFKGLGVGFVASLQLLLLLSRDVASSRERYDHVKRLISEIDFSECRHFVERLGGKFDDRAAIAPSRAMNLMEAVAHRRNEIGSAGKNAPAVRQSDEPVEKTAQRW